MGSVTLSVASQEDVTRRALAAFDGQPQGARLSFASVDLLWQTLTRKRWDVLRAMTSAGPIAIREVARRLERDVKAVHGDIRALVSAGIVEETDRGFVFPYDAVHVDFTLTAAA